MVVKEICRKIYDICLVYAQKTETPIAYVNVDVGFECVVHGKALNREFNKTKWDTPLSGAELNVMRKHPDSKKDTSLTLVSLTLYEEAGHTKVISLNNIQLL